MKRQIRDEKLREHDEKFMTSCLLNSLFLYPP